MDLIRFDNFSGGITHNDRDNRLGFYSVMEELDIFTNPGFVEPTRTFGADGTGLAARKVFDYTIASTDVAYMYQTSSDGDAEIFSLAAGSGDNPGNWATFNESTSDIHANAALTWFQWNDAASNLYYTTASGATITLRKLLISGPTEASVGALTGLDGAGDRVQMIKGFGQLFITNGAFIAKVAADGTFTEKAFTLPTDLTAVSMDLRGDLMYILCKFTSSGINKSRIVVWDLTATSQTVEIIDIPTRGPQWIVNHKEILRVLCISGAVASGIATFYEIPGIVPTKTHEIFNNFIKETDLQPVSPTKTVFIKDGVLYFALTKNTNSGLYALGQVTSQSPLALILAKRFDTSSYASHVPNAATAFGPNWFVAFRDSGTEETKRVEENQSGTRSSNAQIETTNMDLGSIDTIKDVKGVIVTSKALTTSNQQFKVDFKVDNASTFDTNSLSTLTNADDFTATGGVPNTYWHRILTSVAGRLVKMRIRFTSDSSVQPVLYSVTVLTEERTIV